MRLLANTFLTIIIMALAVSCGEGVTNPNRGLTMAAYEGLRESDYAISKARLWEQIGRQIQQDNDSTTADFRTRSHYLKGGSLVWVDRKGIDGRADTLLRYLHTVEAMGMSLDQFRVGQIEADLKRFRALEFDTLNTISRVMGRLEYNLTKAYLRYTVGQRFGFVNPKYLFNHLDRADTSNVDAGYRSLFDIQMQLPRPQFFEEALTKATTDSLGTFLRAIQPTNAAYGQLLAMLGQPGVDKARRAKILVNLERCRWRLEKSPQQCSKYVFVNVPAFHLWAVDGDNVLDMRVGCGSTETKTPLLTSDIKRMDINPQWIIPKSIVKNSIVHHLGDSGYFARHHYFIRERSTGKTIDPRVATEAMVTSPNYLVIQEGGDGNAMGRIVFRFDNAFSVYLHDTSSRDVFARSDRGVSHGCVRVEKPYELAVFLMAEKDERTMEKVNYSMNADVSNIGRRSKKTEDGNPDTLDRSKLIGTYHVEPRVPIFIDYYTLFPDPKGTIREYSDVYGYDKVIYQYLNNYR